MNLRLLLHDSWKALAIGAAPLLAVVGIGCSSTVEPPPGEPIDRTTTKYLYDYNCASCHGLDGSPVGAGVSDLWIYDSTFAEFDSILTDGPGLMPRFPDLDEDERHRLYDYVKQFGTE